MKKIISFIIVISMLISIIPVLGYDSSAVQRAFDYFESLDSATQEELFYNLMYVYLPKDKDVDTIIGMVENCTDTSTGIFDGYIRKILKEMPKEEVISGLKKVKNIPEKYRKPRFMNFYTASSGDTKKVEIPTEKKLALSLLWTAMEKTYSDYFKVITGLGIDERVVADFLPLFCEMNNNKAFLTASASDFTFGINEIDASLNNRNEIEEDLKDIVKALNSCLTEERILIGKVLRDFGICVTKSSSSSGSSSKPSSNGNDNVAPVPKPETFSDISSHWAKKYIENLASTQIIKGYEDNTFKPDNYVTREEASVITARLFQKSGAANTLSFADDKDISSWAKDSVYSLVNSKMINGYSDNTFKPQGNITREELLAIILRGTDFAFDQSKELFFKDNNDISGWAIDIIKKAVQNEIINGYEDNTFKPRNNITRAELTVIISKIKSKI